MELDQILSGSLGYAKSSWGKVATLGAIYLVTVIIMFAGMLVAGFINNFAVWILMGIVLFIIALIAGLIYSGYIFRVIKASLAGINELPGFDEFPGMIIDGVKVVVVGIIYGIIYSIIMGIIMGILFLVMMIAGGMTSLTYAASYTSYMDPTAMMGFFLMGWVMYLAIFIAMLIWLAITAIFAIVVPMGIANMALKGSIGAAFSIGDIKERIENIRWGKALLWVVALYFIFIIAWYVSIVLSLLLIGLIIVPLLIMPYLSIFFARSTALLFEEGE